MTILRPLSSEIDVTGIPFEGNVKPVIKFSLPSQENIPKYLFRYISLQAFINMFFIKQIIFRSAVTYKDINECTYPYQQLFRKIENKGRHQSIHDYYFWMSRERGRFYISCWFGSNNPYPKETMRNSFSKDGVIVAFDGKKLVESFKSDINILYLNVNTHSPDDFKLHSHGHVNYYAKNEIIKDINNGLEIPHPAFAKTKEFELENEYRFVVDIDKKLLEFNFLNETHSTGKTLGRNFDDGCQSILARLANNKSFNDIGLIKIIACSDQTMSALAFFDRMREVKFSQLLAQDDKHIFTQKDDDAIQIIDWRSAVDNGIEDI